MEQNSERGRTEEADMKQQQDRRLKPMQPENQQHQPPPQQPQKCPRCESLNTKFCYYNNYSLSQPRYFCKTCRRYWTQGGTLRNVPVGGGSRKGKRTKTSNSGENSRSQPPLIQQQGQQTIGTAPTLISTNSGIAASPALRNKEPPSSSSIPPMNSYYSGAGGFLSSLAAIQSLNQPQAFNQPINVGGNFGSSSSNMALLQGFNVTTFSSQQQIQQSEFFQMGNRDKNVEPLFPSQESLIQPNRTISSHQDWHQNLINSTNPNPSDGGLWNSSTSNSNSNTVGSASMNPYQWPDLPGYGPPP